MSDLPSKCKNRLVQLENNCRRQVFNVSYLANYNSQRKVREANALGLALSRLVSGPLRAELIRSKNEAIRRFQLLVQAKLRQIELIYIYQKREIQVLQIDSAGPVQSALTSDLFSQYQPVLFHQSLLGTHDPDLPFLPFHIGDIEVVPVQELLEQFAVIYQLVEEIHKMKALAKGLLASNEPADVTETLETYRRLSEVQIPPFHILVVKWGICIHASEAVVAQLHLVKALLHQVMSNRPIEENSPMPELPFKEELEAYAEACFTSAVKCREQDHKKEAGFWLSLVRKLHKVLGRDSLAADTYYGEALKGMEKYSEALAMFKSVLRAINAQDLDDGSRAVVMKLIADTYYNLHKPEKKIMWLQRLVDLGLHRDTEAVDLYDIRTCLSYELIHEYRFEESEAVLLRLNADYSGVGTSICNAFGFLYLVWEQFAKSEDWLKRGIALSPKTQSNLQLNLCNLYFKLGKLQCAEQLLVVYLRTAALSVHDRAYAMTSIARLCLERQEFSKAKQWLERAAYLDEKWQSDEYQQGRRWYVVGMLSIEEGKYEQAQAELASALRNYTLFHLVEQPILVSCKLAEALLLQGKVQEAEDCLAGINEELLKRVKGRTTAAALFEMRGRVCLAKQDLGQARDWLGQALLIQESLVPGTKATARTYTVLGYLELAAERYTEAHGHFTHALEIHDAAIEAYSGLAEVYIWIEDWQSAQTCLETALQCFQSLPNHPLACKLQQQLQALPPH